MATSKDKQKPGQPAGTRSKTATGAEAAELLGDKIQVGAEASSLVTKAGAVAVIALGASLALSAMEGDSFRHFSYSYLTAYVWGLAIGLGGVYWTTLQNLVNAKWSVVLRRLGELVAGSAPILGLLSLPIVIPVLLGSDTLYEWANHERAHTDHVLHHKSPYLNAGFFAVRFVVYFAFWTWLSRFFLKNSLEQDRSGSVDPGQRMKRAAGPAMIGFALTLTFCSIDLIMSLDARWFSTIFGVYYFASCVLAINSSIVLLTMWLQKHGRLTKSVTVEHFHDLGKMMFAFTVFWAYVGFSQFMLIWYANIPEETVWYKHRFEHGWGALAWALVIVHFVVPFFGLLSRHVKRHRKALAFWACWLLGVIYLDMYWLVMPQFSPEHVPFGLIDLTCLVGVAAALIAGFAYRAKNLNLVPVKDPRLSHSLAFENV